MSRSLNLYPAIDLKDGRCVRLLHGRMDQSTIYNEDPASQATSFRNEGFNWIHIVDLNGAFAGRAENAAAVSAILQSTPLKTQLGGGIRSMEAVERWLSAGITRVILGTAAARLIRNELLLASMRKMAGSKLTVGTAILAIPLSKS